MNNSTRQQSTNLCRLQRPFSENPITGPEASIEIKEIHPDDITEQLTQNSTIQPDRFSILWIKEGTGHLLIDIDHCEIHNDLIICLAPGQFHHFDQQTKIKGYHIFFPASFMKLTEPFAGLTYYDTIGQARYCKTHVTENAISVELEDLVQSMIKETESNCMLSPEVLRGLLGILLIHLARNCSSSKSQPRADHDALLAKRFNQLLNERASTRQTVSNYASELSITPNYLNQVVKRYSGVTASHHIQQRTITEAKRQVLYFGNTMKQIAYSLGFDDLAHFSKFFKKNAGTNFRDFKSNTINC